MSEITKSDWISVRERLPMADEYPCWVTDGKEIDKANRGYRYSGVLPAGFPMSVKGWNDWDATITHFCHYTKPTPPPLPPPTSASEKAKACYVAYLNKYKWPTERNDVKLVLFTFQWIQEQAAITAKEGSV